MSRTMTPERYADLRDYSQRVGKSDEEAEVSKADLADLIARIDSAETTLARVRAAVEGPHPANSGLDSFTLAHIYAHLGLTERTTP